MKEFVKFMLLGYWNDHDGRIAGYRSSIIFIYIMFILGVVVPLIFFIKTN